MSVSRPATEKQQEQQEQQAQQEQQEQQVADKSTASGKVMKVKGFTTWRATANVSIASETVAQLDAMLLSLDWTRLLGFVFPDVLEQFPVNSTFVHAYARENFDVKVVAMRERLANTLAWIASRVMFAAADAVKKQGRNRVMPLHVDAAFAMFKEFVGGFEWRGIDPPARLPATPSETSGEKSDKKKRVADDGWESTAVATAATPASKPEPPAAKKAKKPTVKKIAPAAKAKTVDVSV